MFRILFFICVRLKMVFYFRQRTYQFGRLMTNTSVLPSIILGVVAIMAPILFDHYEPDIDDHLWTKIWMDLQYYVYGLFVMLLLLGRYYFKKQTPEGYAAYSIKGRSISDAIRYVAYFIWKETLFLERYQWVFRKFQNLSDDQGALDNCRLKGIHINIVDRLERKFNGRYHNIQTIDFMIVDLAKGMNIPAQRVSDHLFQFSPEIYTSEVRTTLRKMRETMRLDVEDSGLNPRRLALGTQVYKFFDLVKHRQEYQQDLIKFKSLHNILIGISSGFGLTTSLLAYCQGLQQVSRLSIWAGSSRRKRLKTVRRLKFIYHKRRMFPGFDLHAIILNMTLRTYKNTNPAKKEDRDEAFMIYRGTKLLAVKSSEEIMNTRAYSQVIASIQKISDSVQKYIYEQRIQIISNLKKYIMSQLETSPSDIKNLVVITQGFSSVVNEALYKLIDIYNQDAEFRNSIGKKSITYFVLTGPKEMDTLHYTVTRYVRYKYWENPNIPAETQYKVNVKIGTFDWFESQFVNRSETLVYLMSGAEFVQPKDDQCLEHIFMNTEGVKKIDLERLRVGENGAKHIVLFEDFKYFKYFNDERFMQVAFNRDHLEHIHLYSWGGANKYQLIGAEEVHPKV